MFNRDTVQRKFGNILKNVVKELSECVTVVSVSRQHECPNCYVDTITGKSTGVCKHGPELPNYFSHGRCPVCHGEGTIDYKIKKNINASVVWKGDNSSTSRQNDLVFNDCGESGIGIARLKTDICYLNLFKSCDYVIVDGIKCTLHNPPIVKGLGGKHIIVVYVHTVDKISGKEIIKPNFSF